MVAGSRRSMICANGLPSLAILFGTGRNRCIGSTPPGSLPPPPPPTSLHMQSGRTSDSQEGGDSRSPARTRTVGLPPRSAGRHPARTSPARTRTAAAGRHPVGRATAGGADRHKSRAVRSALLSSSYRAACRPPWCFSIDMSQQALPRRAPLPRFLLGEAVSANSRLLER